MEKVYYRTKTPLRLIEIRPDNSLSIANVSRMLDDVI